MNLPLMALVPLLAAGPPPTPVRPVSDAFHGVAVAEGYRWLEDGSAAEVKAWSDAQNAHARAYLDALAGRDAVAARVRTILTAETVHFYGLTHRGDHLFALKRQPPKQQPFLVVMPSADAPDAGRAVVDPNVIDPSGKTHIDWYVPSPDGALVAVSMSKAGTESGDVHVYDVATGEPVHEVVPRVNGGTAGGDVAWAPDGKGFFYTRYPRGEERPVEDRDFYQQLYFHALGTPTAEDRYELGRDLPRIAEIQLEMHHPSGRLLATVQKGDGGEFSHHLRAKDGTWRTFSAFGDKTLQATFGPRDDLYVLSRAGAPRGKLLRVPIATLDVAKAPVVVAEGPDTIVEDFWGPPTFFATPTRLVVTYQLGGPSTLRLFDLDGERLADPDLPPVTAVSGLTTLGGEALLVRNSSFIAPERWLHLDAATAKVRRTKLESTSPVDNSDVEVVRAFATSKDGTKVPLNIIRPKGAPKDGARKVVVNGYGGYGVNLAPYFNPTHRVFLERDVWYVVANLRGGGEYGEAWHRQGNLTNKQNVFDDFHAVLRHLTDTGYTKPEHTAIIGGSNGGLLMGATFVQHPEAVAAVVSFVGIYDMLRVELSPNGAFNVPEFGTVKNPEHFRALRGYSPYHNVKDGTAYPPVLFVTGENDPRVDPMQSRKMTARLQAAVKGTKGGPILLRTSKDAGHGGGSGLDERIAQTTDAYAFLLHALKAGAARK